jgi:CheY-like chemotaxis protein
VLAIAAHPALEIAGVPDNGCRALSMIIHQRPDVALLEVRFPGIDGFSVCERLASAPPPQPTRVVLLSAVLDYAQIASA